MRRFVHILPCFGHTYLISAVTRTPPSVSFVSSQLVSSSHFVSKEATAEGISIPPIPNRDSIPLLHRPNRRTTLFVCRCVCRDTHKQTSLTFRVRVSRLLSHHIACGVLKLGPACDGASSSSSSSSSSCCCVSSWSCLKDTNSPVLWSELREQNLRWSKYAHVSQLKVISISAW